MLAVAMPSKAILDITITEGLASAQPIAIVPFAWEGQGQSPVDIGKVISDDLSLSGRFAPMPFVDLPARPSDFSEINFRDWKLLGMDYLLVGKLIPAGGSYQVEFRLVNVFRGEQMVGFRIPSEELRLRRTAHQIADIVFEKLTGERGAFATRVAYVTVEGSIESGREFRLQVADADGYDPKVLRKSSEPILSPAWSPDGDTIAYVDFVDGNSSVVIQTLADGSRETVASYPGLNSAPAFSPDGKKLALTLSKDGNPEIYLLDLKSRRLQRLTNNQAIDTEANFSPDGSRLAFTSDRGGGPQIYELDIRGGNIRRVTFNKGNYNARPRFSPDGERIVMVNGGARGYRIAVLELASDSFTLLTDSRLDESPSFAPNGSMIVYATTGFRGSELAATSVDGRVKQRLSQQQGEVREPAWGPLED